MSAVAASNEGQADWLLDRLEGAAGRSVAGWRVALLGLTFKADTDDLRESPALRLARRLVARGASVVCFDPLATAAGVAALRAEGLDVTAADSAEAACNAADAVVVATEWPQFRLLEWQAIARQMRGVVIADARHVVDVDEAARAGLTVIALGVIAKPAAFPGAAIAPATPVAASGRSGSAVSATAALSAIPSPFSAADVARTRLPVDQASMLPPRAFHAADVFDFEQAAWFGRDWLCVGREEDAARPASTSSPRSPRRASWWCAARTTNCARSTTSAATAARAS